MNAKKVKDEREAQRAAARGIPLEDKTSQADDHEGAREDESMQQIKQTVTIEGVLYGPGDEDKLEERLDAIEDDAHRENVVRRLTEQGHVVGFGVELGEALSGDPTIAASRHGRAKGLHNVLVGGAAVDVGRVADHIERTDMAPPAQPAGAAETRPGESDREVRGLEGRQVNDPTNPAAPGDTL